RIGECQELRLRRGEVHRRIVKEGYAAVGMRHRTEPSQHPARQPLPTIKQLRGNAFSEDSPQRERIEESLQDGRVVHRAALEVAAVGEYLLWELCLEDAQSRVQPLLRLGAVKKKRGKHERLGIGEQVITEQMVFQPNPQAAHLIRETALRRNRETGFGTGPLDPIYDSQ